MDDDSLLKVQHAGKWKEDRDQATHVHAGAEAKNHEAERYWSLSPSAYSTEITDQRSFGGKP